MSDGGGQIGRPLVHEDRHADPGAAASLLPAATLRQLAYLVAVVDHGSFTAAASELHVAQPSLSQQVRLLERTVGGPLLERLPQGVRPTAAGLVLLPKARAALHAVGDGTLLARREIEEPGGLCLSVVAGAPNALLSAAVGRWRDAHPGTTVRWHEFPDQARIEEKVRDAAGVVAIAEAPRSWEGTVVPLTEEPLVLARPAAAPAGRALPLVATGFEGRLPDVASLSAEGVLDAPGLAEALALVRAGAAVAVLPESLTGDGGVHVERLDSVAPRRIVALLAPRPTRAAADMGAILRDLARRRGSVAAA